MRTKQKLIQNTAAAFRQKRNTSEKDANIVENKIGVKTRKKVFVFVFMQINLSSSEQDIWIFYIHNIFPL